MFKYQINILFLKTYYYFLILAQSVYRTDMPPPYPGIIGFSNNPGYASAPPAQTTPQPQQLNGQGTNQYLFY